MRYITSQPSSDSDATGTTTGVSCFGLNTLDDFLPDDLHVEVEAILSDRLAGCLKSISGEHGAVVAGEDADKASL